MCSIGTQSFVIRKRHRCFCTLSQPLVSVQTVQACMVHPAAMCLTISEVQWKYLIVYSCTETEIKRDCKCKCFLSEMWFWFLKLLPLTIIGVFIWDGLFIETKALQALWLFFPWSDWVHCMTSFSSSAAIWSKLRPELHCIIYNVVSVQSNSGKLNAVEYLECSFKSILQTVARMKSLVPPQLYWYYYLL